MNEMTFKAYWKVKNTMAKLENKFNEESGMETLEAVILIVIAVIVAGFLVNVLTKGHFGDSNDGLIGYLFNQIGQRLGNIFATNEKTYSYNG